MNEENNEGTLYCSSFQIQLGKTRGKREDEIAGKKKSKKEKELPEVAPELVVKPRHQFIDDGGDAKFKASFDGSKNTTVLWSKDGNVLGADDHYKIYEENGFQYLEVINATVADNGIYTVTVQNSAGSDSASTDLEVFEKPKLLTRSGPEWELPLEDITVAEGEEGVELSCTSRDLTQPSVKWFLNGKELFSGFRTKIEHSGQTATLTIKKAQERDSGEYKCVMSGKNAELETACQMTIKHPEKMSPPVFVKELHDMEVEEGDKLELDVEVKGTPPNEVFWFHNNVEITHDNPHFLLASLGHVHTLTLPRATSECSGEYVCEAYNEYGDTDTFCLIDVKEVEHPEAPEFVTQPLALKAQEGQMATFTCKVKGQPMPTVMWEKESVLITPSQKYKTTCIQDQHTLTVYDIDQTDAGDYVCHLHSSVGSTSHPCHLQVSGCPRRAEAVNILKSRLSHLARESQSPPAVASLSRGSKPSPSGPQPRGQFSQYRQQILEDTGAVTVLSSKSLTVHSPSAPTISSLAHMKTPPPPSNANMLHQPVVQTLSHTSNQHSHHHESHPHSNKIQHTSHEKTNLSTSLTNEKSSNSAFEKQQHSPVYKAELRPAKTVTHTNHHQLQEKQNTQKQNPVHTKPEEREEKRDAEKSGEIIIEYRSVLKHREKTPVSSEQNAVPKSNVDFREVLSKAKSHGKSENKAENTTVKGGLLGSELRNLQIARNSRNVLSRSGEFTSVNPGTSTWSSSSTSGNQTHRSFGTTRGKVVNSLGLKSVNRALGAMDVPTAPLSNEPSHSLRQSRWRDNLVPQYSPSSSLPFATDSNTSENIETVGKTKETHHSRVAENYSPLDVPKSDSNKFEDNKSELVEIHAATYSKSLPSEVSKDHRFNKTGTATAQRVEIGQSSRPTNMFTPTEKPFSVSIQIPSSTNQVRQPGRLSIVKHDVSKHKLGTEQQSQDIHSGLPAPIKPPASEYEQILVSTNSHSVINEETSILVKADNPEGKEQSDSIESQNNNQEELQVQVKSSSAENKQQSTYTESIGDSREEETCKVSYLEFSPTLSSMTPEQPLQPYTLTFSSKTSSESLSSSPLPQTQEQTNVSIKEHSGRSSHEDGDDVFMEESKRRASVPEEYVQSDVRRGSLKTVGSVFAWEKYDDVMDDTNSTKNDVPSDFKDNGSGRSTSLKGTNDPDTEKGYKSTRTRFSEDILSSSEKPKKLAWMDTSIANTGLKSPSMSSTSSHKSTASSTTDASDFRSVKLKPTATKPEGKGNLKNSKFMSKSNESLFTDVKLKHVPRPDETMTSLISSNSADIRSKSKSSDLTVLFKGQSLQFSPRVQPNTAREISTVSHYPKKSSPHSAKEKDAATRFVEAKKAFSASPDRFAETKHSKPNTPPSLTKSKEHETDKRKITEHRMKPSGYGSHADHSFKHSKDEKMSVTPKPAVSKYDPSVTKSKNESSHLSHATVSKDEKGQNSATVSGRGGAVSKSGGFTEKFHQWKTPDEIGENGDVKTRKKLGETGKSQSNISLMQTKAGSNLNNVPEWVKQKAVNKRHSLQIDKASTLPMSYRHNFEQTERRSRILENKDKPNTPRRFKRDTKDEPLHKDKKEELTPEWANRKPLKNIEEKIKSTAKIKPEKDEAKPEWVKIKSPRELKSMETGEEKTKFIPKFEFGGTPRNNHKGLEAVSAATLFKVSEGAEDLASEVVESDSQKSVLPSTLEDATSGKVKTEKDEDINVAESTGVPEKASESYNMDTSWDQSQGESDNIVTTCLPSLTTITTSMAVTAESNSQATFSTATTATTIPSVKTSSKVIQLAGSAEEDQKLSTEISSTTASVSKSENAASMTKRATADSNYAENKNNMSNRPSTAQTAAENNFKVTTNTESQPDTKPKSDSASVIEQASAKGINIRPSWKKSKSLRHIPIYPINDNELSPRYEPFRPTLDDAESIKSTTSVSSSSSDGSTLTNDSGYPKDSSKDDEHLQDTPEMSSVTKDESTHRETLGTINSDHKAHHTNERSGIHEDSEHQEESQKRTLQDSRDLGLLREKLRETWQENKDHDITEMIYNKRRNFNDGELTTRHRDLDTAENTPGTTRPENNTEISSSRLSRRLKNHGTPYHTPQTSALSTDSGYMEERELSFDSGYSGDKARDLKDDNLEDKANDKLNDKGVSEYSRGWSRRMATENKRDQISELSKPSREFSPSRTRTRAQREALTETHNVRDSSLSKDLPTRRRGRDQKYNVHDDDTTRKGLSSSQITKEPSEPSGSNDKHLSNLEDSTSIVPSHDKRKDLHIDANNSSNELSVTLTKHRYTVEESKTKDTGLNDMSDNAKSFKGTAITKDNSLNSEPLKQESGLISKVSEKISEPGRRKSQYSERTKDRYSHLIPESDNKEFDHTKNKQNYPGNSNDHQRDSYTENTENVVEEKTPATRPSDLDLISNWRSQRSRLRVTTDEKKSSSSIQKDEDPSDATTRTNLSQNETDLKKTEASKMTDSKTKALSTKATTNDSPPLCPPSFPTPLADTSVLYGSKAVLKCQVAGYPRPDIKWLLNHTPVEPSKNTEISYSEDNVAQLTILETFTDNIGDYTCFARNSLGRLSTHCTLSLEASNKTESRAFEGPVSVRPRIVTLTPGAVSLVRGSTLKLTLNFVGEPKPVVKWTQAGKEIVSDGRVDIKTDRTTSCLTIESVRQSDAGKMSVCVSNSIGSDQATANISIEDVPEAPMGKPHVYDIGRTSVALSWCGPASRDESHVTYYIIEAKTRQQKSWDVIVPQCKELSYHIFDLKPTTTYQFRVRAANKHGLGAPSEPSEKIITTDPFRSPIDDESEGYADVFTPTVEFRTQDDLPFEPRDVKVNAKDKFEDFYKLENEVGKGKFGIVYKCKHKTDDKVWAAKIVKCREREKETIRQEIDVMNRLRHPKLLMLYEAYESPRQMILVMEYVGAGELFERVIGEDFVLTERDCVHFLRQICEGVSYMHDNNVLHLDLKPENILCMAETSNRIKIIDFGLARIYKPGESIKVLLGTPEFIAPEVINYDEIDYNTDMWSVGVICYVLLSGLSPFLGDNDAETLANVTTGEFDFDDEAFDEISEQAKDFISQLLIKKKEKRMSTQDCLAHPWLNQDETDGMRYKRLNTERLKRFMVRRKWLKTGNAVLAVSRLLKSSSLSSFNFNRSPSEDSTPSPTSALQYPNLDQTREEEEENEETDPCSKLEPNLKNNVISLKDNVSTTQISTSKLDSSLTEQKTLEKEGGRTEENGNLKESNSNTVNGVSELVTDQNYNQVINPTAGNSAKHCDNSSQDTATITTELHGQSSSSSTSFSSLPPSSKLNHKTDTQQSLITANSVSSNKTPVFSKAMRSCKACSGDVARFDVTVSCDPVPTVTWFCDGEELRADSRHSMESNANNGSFSLIIRSIEEEDEGEYMCKAENSQGETTCAAELTVLDL